MAVMTTDEVQAFTEVLRNLAASRFDRTEVRETGECAELDRDAWRALAESGVLTMTAPEQAGGLEIGAEAAVAAFEELGHGLVPGPLVWSALAAEYLEGVGDGSVVCTGFAVRCGVPLVEHGATADQLVVLAERGVAVHRADSVELTPVSGIDPLTPLALAGSLGTGEAIGDAALARRWWLLGTCLSAAYLVGLARCALEMSVAHAGEREQFGRPIGGFQAVKHLLAGAAIEIEPARAAAIAAGRALDREPTPERACSAAKVVAGEAVRIATRNCIQVHGGMGYTWECDPHLIAKRGMVFERSFGTSREHAVAMTVEMGSEPVVVDE